MGCKGSLVRIQSSRLTGPCCSCSKGLITSRNGEANIAELLEFFVPPRYFHNPSIHPARTPPASNLYTLHSERWLHRSFPSVSALLQEARGLHKQGPRFPAGCYAHLRHVRCREQ